MERSHLVWAVRLLRRKTHTNNPDMGAYPSPREDKAVANPNADTPIRATRPLRPSP